MDFGQMRMDAKKETEGVWFEGPGDSRFLIARFMNGPQRDWLAKNGSKLRVGAQAGLDVSVEATALTKQAVAKFVVLGWSNVALDGEVLEYSEANALRLFNEVTELYELVLTWSQDRTRFREEVITGK